MELEGVKRVAYWISFFVLVFLLGIFMTADRLTILFRVILVILLAILSSMFRLEDRYSFLSIVVALAAGLFTGAILGNNAAQFWAFSFLYIIIFFLSCEVFERKLLGV
jgi:hypothetical protein